MGAYREGYATRIRHAERNVKPSAVHRTGSARNEDTEGGISVRPRSVRPPSTTFTKQTPQRAGWLVAIRWEKRGEEESCLITRTGVHVWGATAHAYTCRTYTKTLTLHTGTDCFTLEQVLPFGAALKTLAMNGTILYAG